MTYCYVRVELSGVFEKKKTVVYYDNCTVGERKGFKTAVFLLLIIEK